MARALIVGCGCRGRELGRELRGRSWEVRGTTRDPAGVRAIEAAGIEAAIADPALPGTVLELCADITVVVWLLGSASGDAGSIHGPKLRSLLEKLVDSPVRGFAYEAAGTAGDEDLRAGRAIVERAADTWRIPVAILEADPGAADWTERTAEAVVAAVTAR